MKVVAGLSLLLMSFLFIIRRLDVWEFVRGLWSSASSLDKEGVRTSEVLGEGLLGDEAVFSISIRTGPLLCLDLRGGSKADGTPLQIWECNGQQSQLWYFDSGSWTIKYGGDSSKCLDAGSMKAGTSLKIWTCNGGDQQKWGYDAKAGTIYLAGSSDASLCMDLAGGGKTGGTNVQAWTCNGLWEQSWNLMAGITIRLLENYRMCLDLSGGKAEDGTPIQLWSCNGQQNQLWKVSAGDWKVRYAADPSKCIDAGSMKYGTKLALWSCNGLQQQKWGYDAHMHSLYLASSSSSDASLCMDIPGGSLSQGNQMQVWSCNGCWNQQFQVVGPSLVRTSERSLLQLPAPTHLRSSQPKDNCPPRPGPSPGPPGPGPSPSKHLGPDATWELIAWSEGKDATSNANMVDIDLFNDHDKIGGFHKAGKVVICYYSAGTAEFKNDRPDIKANEQAWKDLSIAKMSGWDEMWLDITKLDKLSKLMAHRMDLAQQYGCDGVEPDNVDCYDNSACYNKVGGKDAAKAAQIKYNTWTSNYAHSKGLLVALKNADELVPQLHKMYDFSIVEQCLENKNCGSYGDFTKDNKAIFGIEYKSSIDCGKAKQNHVQMKYCAGEDDEQCKSGSALHNC